MQHDVEAMRAENDALRARLDALEARAPATDATDPTERSEDQSSVLRHLSVSGFMQAQYEWSQLSEDQLAPGGVPLNRNRFVLRRARLRVTGNWKHFVFDMEVDGNTVKGPAFGLRHTTVAAVVRNSDAALPPLFELSAGLTEDPFGYENGVSPRDWLFMERSNGAIAMFGYSPLDIGGRVRGGIGIFRYDFAVLGGTPLDNRGKYLGGDPSHVPDVLGRIGAESHPGGSFELASGVSFLTGKGFHAGQDATKPTLVFTDLNGNGQLDANEIRAIPGRAATPSYTFRHWAFNVDFRAGFRTKLGWTRILGELTIAQNLDRTMYIADPISSGNDIREVAGYAIVTQELTKWGLVGFRYDYYNPNADLWETRRGLSVPVNAAVHTLSPIAAFVFPGARAERIRARATFQYDFILDELGRNAIGVPTNLKNNQWTFRVQGSFQ